MKLRALIWDAGVAQWIESRSADPEVPDSNPRAGQNYFSVAKIICGLRKAHYGPKCPMGLLKSLQRLTGRKGLNKKYIIKINLKKFFNKIVILKPLLPSLLRVRMSVVTRVSV